MTHQLVSACYGDSVRFCVKLRPLIQAAPWQGVQQGGGGGGGGREGGMLLPAVRLSSDFDAQMTLMHKV